METIVFAATAQSVKTLADGGIRVSFDLLEHAIPQAAALMACIRNGVALRVVVVDANSKLGVMEVGADAATDDDTGADDGETNT